MHKISIVQKSHCACRVLSLATIRSKYYFNFILNRTRSGRELFDLRIYSYTHVIKLQYFSPVFIQLLSHPLVAAAVRDVRELVQRKCAREEWK